MTLLEQGDVVVSHINGALRYAGVVTSRAVSDRKPDFGFAGNAWSDDGWSVEMRFKELPNSVRPQDHLSFYGQVAPARYAPMTSAGRVNQQYLFSLPEILGEFYLKAGGVQPGELKSLLRTDPSVESALEEAERNLSSTVLTTTERHVLARARLGQGMFKEEVRRIESACRLTGVSDPEHLVASHMKPWSKSDNAERLDGNNGLLLSPHVDNLFDRGLITFSASGRVVNSPQLNLDVPRRWKLDLTVSTGKFHKSQLPYLEYHQNEVFRQAHAEVL
jgi:putative restriction endonuclease